MPKYNKENVLIPPEKNAQFSEIKYFLLFFYNIDFPRVLLYFVEYVCILQPESNPKFELRNIAKKIQTWVGSY